MQTVCLRQVNEAAQIIEMTLLFIGLTASMSFASLTNDNFLFSSKWLVKIVQSQAVVFAQFQ